MTDAREDDDIIVLDDDAKPVVQEDEYGAPIEAKKAPSVDDGIEALKAQKVSLEERLANETRAREAAEKQAQYVPALQQRTLEGDLQQIRAGKEIVERDTGQTKSELATAMEQGDFQRAADLQEKLAEFKVTKQRLDTAEANVAQRIERGKQEQANPPRQQQREMSVQEQQQAYLNGLSERTRSWMIAHPEYYQDPRKNQKAYAAHLDAVAENIQPDSPEYFQHVEARLGLSTSRQRRMDSYSDDPPARSISAPVSRDVSTSSTSMPRGRQEVRLTAEEKDFCRLNDLTFEEYAREKIKLAAGH